MYNNYYNQQSNTGYYQPNYQQQYQSQASFGDQGAAYAGGNQFQQNYPAASQDMSYNQNQYQTYYPPQQYATGGMGQQFGGSGYSGSSGY